MKKAIGPLLSLVLLIGIGFAIYQSMSEKAFLDSLAAVNGLIGSEKQEFFDDQRVKDRLRELGLVVNYQKAGSRQIATSFNLAEYDYVFPAGLPAAEKIRQEVKHSKSFNPFFTPMAIASWKPIVDILVDNGLAKNQGDYYLLDMDAFLKAVGKNLRWSDLKNNSAFDVNKAVLINSTDIRKSNSAAMYLSLASYVLNNQRVIQNQEQINAVLPMVTALFQRQGFVENSSAAPFQDYLVMGMGKAPLVMMYESQFIYQASLNDGSVLPDMVLMYPEPSLFTKHVLLGLTENGNKLGQILESDPQLQQLAIEHGFRNANSGYFRDFIKQHNISVAPTLVNVIEPPTYEIVEGMIQRIEQNY